MDTLDQVPAALQPVRQEFTHASRMGVLKAVATTLQVACSRPAAPVGTAASSRSRSGKRKQPGSKAADGSREESGSAHPHPQPPVRPQPQPKEEPRTLPGFVAPPAGSSGTASTRAMRCSARRAARQQQEQEAELQAVVTAEEPEPQLLLAHVKTEVAASAGVASAELTVVEAVPQGTLCRTWFLTSGGACPSCAASCCGPRAICSWPTAFCSGFSAVLRLPDPCCPGKPVQGCQLGHLVFVLSIHQVLPLPAADSKEARRACLDRYREKKRHRAAAGSKIRYEMRRVNAEQRPRFKVGTC